MSIHFGLMNVCLLAEGFPRDISAVEVARYVTSATKAAVCQVAPLNRIGTDTSSGWLLLLQSHDDQIRCLINHKTFYICLGNKNYEIKLNFPEMTFTSHELDWTTVMNKDEEEVNPMRTMDMFGDGQNANSTEEKSRMGEEHGQSTSGFPMVSNPPPGFHGFYRPPNTTPQGMEWQGYVIPQTMEHGPFSPPLQPPGPGLFYAQGTQQDQQPFYNPYGSNPNISRAGLDASRPMYPYPRKFSQGAGQPPGFFQQSYPAGQEQRSVKLGVHPSEPFAAPNFPGEHPTHGSNPSSMTYPQSSEKRRESLQEGMENLNLKHDLGLNDLDLRSDFDLKPGLDLKHDTFVNCPSSDQQAADSFGSSMGYPDANEFQSDFVVIVGSAEQDVSLEHPCYLLVTELPQSITEEELKDYFQDRHQSGGGPVSKVRLDSASGSAAIFFSDDQVIHRVIQRSPLLLKDKKIRVELARTEDQLTQPELEVKMVEIRGLQSEDETEMCMYYFENPAKGGGDIESSDWNEQEKIFYITFKDPEVARTVTSKGHRIGNKVLEVSLYVPPVEEAEDSQPQCTVEVRGFDPDKAELYEIYFSNPKRGGDTVVDLSLSPDNSVMSITFETPEVAQRVAGMSHKVGGKQLEVIVAPVEDPTPPSTILVRGCDLEMEEMYRFYFENPKKGGGDITDFVVDRDKQAILITFQDPEVAQAVVSKQHNIGRRNLDVSLYTPKKPSAKPQTSQEPAKEEDEEVTAPLRTVVVSVGQHSLESDETYALYFESPRHGGGEVESVDFDEEKRLAYITFADPTVAERVVKKQHKIAGHAVHVELYVPPKPKPCYPNKLLFRNVADSTTRDCLQMYLERTTDLEPTEILYGDEVGTVLVTFEEEPDFNKTLQMTQKKPLEKRQLTVSKVPISNCLLVENLGDKTTEDTVGYYFENKRSRGGPVERVEMVPEENKCFVYFESHEVLDGVLSHEHILDGKDLDVKRYMECLGQSGGNIDPTAFTLPKPLVLDRLDRYKVTYLRQSQSARSGFLQQLSSSYAQGKFEGSTLIIDCTLTIMVSKARILARTWEVDVEQTVVRFLDLLEVLKRSVMQQLWQEIDAAVKGVGIRSPEGAALFHVGEESAFVVVGMKSMAKDLFDHVCNIIKTKEEEIERRNQEVTETNPKLQAHQLNLLMASGFPQRTGRRHEGLKVDIQKKKNIIVFHGLLKDVKESQIEMYELLHTVKREKITSMSDLQKKTLETKETKLYIIQKFKNEKISAVWELGQQGEIDVFAFDDPPLVKAIHIINKSVPEHVCQLSPESSQLLQSRDWQSLVSQLTGANAGVLMITPSHDGLQIFVTCIDSIMHGIVEEVEKFLAENTIYSQTVSFSPSRQKLVHMMLQVQLQSVASKLRAYKVQLTLPDPGDKICIMGTRQGLEQLMKRLEDMNQRIVCHEKVFTDPSKVKLLSSECEKDLIMIGRSCRCVLSLRSENSQLQVVESGSRVPAVSIQMSSAMQTLTSIQLPSGASVSVVQGDITQMEVGAIVNAANNRMDHAGGLARDIVKKGGEEIQKECYQILKQRGQQLKEGDIIVSGSGRLRCSCIIHAVGPLYRGGHSGEQDCLFDTVMSCLQTANEKGLSSIAIPAISTGIFGYPAPDSTMVILEAVKTFFDSHRRCKVTGVYLCHNGKDIVSLFVKALQKTFPSARSSSTVYNKPTPAARKGHPYSQPPATSAGNMAVGVYSSHRIINVSIIPGEIAKQTAEVIVNSTSNGLDLQNGAVSSSILRAAGVGLQVECKSRYPGGIQVGEVARTRGHGLSCREVFHIVLCNFSNPKAQQILSGTVVSCLTEASNQQYTSLAFPVLGTGNLGYPAPLVACTMLKAIDLFERQIPSTSLRDVRIVVYPSDRNNLQEFQAAQSEAGGDHTGSLPSHTARLPGGRQHRVFAEESAAQTSKSWGGSSFGGSSLGGASGAKSGDSASHAEFDIGGLRFVIKKGDITEEDTDAIVNSTNHQLDLSRGGVASALKKKCGHQLERECKSKVQEIQSQGVIMTKAYQLKSKIIFHMDADQFSGDWEDGIERCLKMAEQNGVRSIAMPALGTGIGLSPGMSASALFNTLVKMYQHSKRHSSLQEVRVVLFDKKMIPPFVSAVQQTGEKHNKSRKGIFSMIKSEVKQTVNNPAVEEVSLYIYATCENDVKEALKSFDEIAQDKFTRKEIVDELITTLEDEDVRRIQRIGERQQVELQIQQWTGRIIADGLFNKVCDCVNEITAVIREVDHKRQTSEAAAMLANMIRWCYLEVTQTGTEQKEYQPKENHIIEMAYKGKKPHAEIRDSAGTVYIIDFNSMMEYPKLEPSDTVSVLRKDRIRDMSAGQVPTNWEPHQPSETVKEVRLQPTDPEYQQVTADFAVSVGNVTITGVSRVQNPHLYHQYMTKKAHLENQNQGVQNEKMLWHGTSADAIPNINHHGFNRSFCGKNATVYGEGVYFAINANYSASATYSPPDTAGNRYVYRCKVLVGHTTTGGRNLRVLPPRQGPVLYDSATDNPNSPSMYVIFNDTQAYPEYLVTFK